VDLAKGFEASNKEKLSQAEIDQFMQNCVNLALQTAPNLITARLLQVELDKRNFVLTHNKLIYKQLENNIIKLFADGYLELPELMYSEQPKTVGLDSTYTPFAQENIREGTPTGKGTVLTLSNGRYAEFKNAKIIETIGSVRFDTEKKKIVGFGENKRQVEVVSRFLSVDPIAKSYPELTPYQFASNRPIDGIDLDGLEYLRASVVRKGGMVSSDHAPVIEVQNIKSEKLNIPYKHPGFISIPRTSIEHPNAFAPHERAMQLGVELSDGVIAAKSLFTFTMKGYKALKAMEFSYPKNTLFSGFPYIEVKSGLKMLVEDSKINVHNLSDDWVGAGTYNFYNKSIYFTIETQVKGMQLAHGGTVFSNIVDKFDEIYGKHNVQEIEAVWGEDLPDNLNTFNRVFNELYKDGKGLSIKAAQESAARATFTGKMAERHGFEGVEILSTEGKVGQYTDVHLIFNQRK
jgi:hypothetical protein